MISIPTRQKTYPFLKHLFICTTLSSALVFTGCANMTNEQGGLLAGAAVGGALGSLFGGGSGRVAAAIIGTGIGAFIGSRIGQSMDRTDAIALNRTLESNPTGQTRAWTNPDTHNRYRVTPVKTYKQNGEFCRRYHMTAVIDGKAEKLTGNACRQPNGVWKTV